MAVAKKKHAPAKARKNGAGAVDLEKFRAELSEEGKILFDLAMSVPEEELMSTEEILAEIARRRGGLVIINK
jgi:hypothetical protein